MFNRFFGLFFLVIPFTWGGSFIAGKYVVHEMDPFTSVMFRFLLSAGVMLPFLILKYRKTHPYILDVKFIKHIIIVVLTSGLGYHIFFFSALKFTSPTNTAIIIALNPFFTAFAETFLFRRKRPYRFYMGFILSFAGAIWVNLAKGGEIDFSSLGWGELFCLGAALSWTLYTLLAKATKKQEWDALWINAYNYLLTGLILIPFLGNQLSPSFLSSISMAGWFGLLYMAIFPTVIGYTLFYIGVQKKGPGWAVTFIYLVPSITAMLDFAFFRAVFTMPMFLGTTLVVIGLITGNLTEKQKEFVKRVLNLRHHN
ncbi:MAG: EamA family transporter [Caldithrix sp.]|nr:EamA family transporter [Caldithrix sp.]